MTPQTDKKENPLFDFIIPFVRGLFWMIFVVILLIISLHLLITM